MTWSIVAYDKASGAFAAAVTTRSLAVGSRCPFVRAGVGAVCTQSISNWYLGPKILDLIERDVEPVAAIEVALLADEGRHLRQVHAVDRHGRTAAWTGRNCVDWAGDRPGDGFSVAGNMLPGEAVVDTTFETYLKGGGLVMPERMLAAVSPRRACAMFASSNARRNPVACRDPAFTQAGACSIFDASGPARPMRAASPRRRCARVRRSSPPRR